MLMAHLILQPRFAEDAKVTWLVDSKGFHLACNEHLLPWFSTTCIFEEEMCIFSVGQLKSFYFSFSNVYTLLHHLENKLP